MRVAFLGHNQALDGSIRPSGGYISKSEAEALVLSLAAERISQKRIRAFPPDSPFRVMRPELLGKRGKLPPREVGGCKFVPPRTDLRPSVAALRSGWDWTHEANYLSA